MKSQSVMGRRTKFSIERKGRTVLGGEVLPDK